MKPLTLNGRPWINFNAESETIQLSPSPRRCEIGVHF
jgi:hypothetical protein